MSERAPTSQSASRLGDDDAEHIGTLAGDGTLCGAPPANRSVVEYESGRSVDPAAGCWMCISNYRAEVGW